MNLYSVRFYGELHGAGTLEVGPGWAVVRRRGLPFWLPHLAGLGFLALVWLYLAGAFESGLFLILGMPAPVILWVYIWPRRGLRFVITDRAYEAIRGADWETVRRMLEEAARAEGVDISAELSDADLEIDESRRVHFSRRRTPGAHGFLFGATALDWFTAEFERPDNARGCVELYGSLPEEEEEEASDTEEIPL